MGADRVALAHDYATQRGGAERVALAMVEGFPGAPMHTSLYDPEGTFPEFGAVDLRTTRLDRFGVVRRHHRLGLPFLASAVSATPPIESEVLLASSTGWAHGFRSTGRKVVYCHAPARWLYQSERYLGAAHNRRGLRRWVAARSLDALAPSLRAWDRRAALSADRYLANSSVTARSVREVYGIDAEVLPPPPALLPDGPSTPPPGVEGGFLLCVARLLPYKNVDVVLRAAQRLGARLVVVGEGPDRGRLERLAQPIHGARLLGRVSDAELRWLYGNCSALVAASFEDYGLSPLEAAAFGRPAVVLRDGGYLDTVREHVTGEFFDIPEPEPVARAVDCALRRPWSASALRDHADAFAAPRFVARLRAVVEEELCQL
ncbi:glycosyltransferase [Cellulomonas cellasea]|uniref:glycosyltransferase n=1 Tax=Cellulomonas cellasea TaxID=43670 RepID=UPI0025A349F4|nr:glycosyltransferase [Cellulomonas cellasea]MDM8083264.1 glycosyltransferase [Cellulomonas cellasea]